MFTNEELKESMTTAIYVVNFRGAYKPVIHRTFAGLMELALCQIMENKNKEETALKKVGISAENGILLPT